MRIKKFVIPIVIGLLVVGLAGCTKQSTSDSPAKPKETPEKTEPKTAETAIIGEWQQIEPSTGDMKVIYVFSKDVFHVPSETSTSHLLYTIDSEKGTLTLVNQDAKNVMKFTFSDDNKTLALTQTITGEDGSKSESTMKLKKISDDGSAQARVEKP